MSQAESKDLSLKSTALHPLHVELGGKLVAFAGYELPVQFRGIRDEHLHTRTHASLFDISHMGQFRLTGSNAAAALERLVPNRITNLAPGRQRYTVLLNDTAGIVDDLMVTNTGDGLFLVVNAACKAKDWQYLRDNLGDAVQLEELDDRSLIAVQGPDAAGALDQLGLDSSGLPFMHATDCELDGIPCFISRSGYTGEDGFEISLPSSHANALAGKILEREHVLPAGLGARDTLRLEAGLCLYGHELDENITPVEAGLNWLLSGERLQGAIPYRGRDVIIRQLHEGVQRKRVGIVVEGKVPVREGTTLLNPENIASGYVSSGSFSPSLEQPVAMAYVDSKYCENDTSLLAEVRQRTHPVRVTGLPFVPHRYYLQNR